MITYAKRVLLCGNAFCHCLAIRACAPANRFLVIVGDFINFMESDMIRITVAQTTVKELKGTSAKTGKPYELRFQTGYAHTQDKDGNAPPYPEKFEMSLERDQQPYAPGEYTLHPSAVYIDRDGRLAISPRLTPVKSPSAA